MFLCVTVIRNRYLVSEMTHFVYLFWFWKLEFLNYKLHMKLTFFPYQQMFFLVYLSVLENCLPSDSGTVLMNEAMHAVTLSSSHFIFFIPELMARSPWGCGGEHISPSRPGLFLFSSVTSWIGAEDIWRHFLHKLLIQSIVYFYNEKISTIFYFIFANFFSLSITTEHFFIFFTITFLKLRPELLVISEDCNRI